MLGSSIFAREGIKNGDATLRFLGSLNHPALKDNVETYANLVRMKAKD
jgi:hypothetical protein